MSNVKSAAKRARQSVKRRVGNRAVLRKISTIRRAAFETVVEGVDPAVATRALSRYSSVLDKAVKRGVIKRNTADRRKSRLAKRVASLATAAVPAEG